MSHEDYRARRDSAGIGPHVRGGIRVVPLHELRDVHIADGEPDIRGWDVRTLSGRDVGKVHDLLVDTEAGEVVMLDIDLSGSDRHTLAPIRAAQLDRARRVVMLDTAELRAIDDFPSLARHAALTDEEARLFSEGYDRAYGDRGWDRAHDVRLARGVDDIRFHRRAADLGAAAAVPRRDRDVAIDRNVDREREREREDAADRGAERVTARGAFEDTSRDEVRYSAQRERDPESIPSGTEEVVIERRPLVVEEVVVRRRVIDASASANDDDLHAAAVDPNVRRDPRLRKDEGEARA